MNALNVAVLFGGRSCEHDVSIISGMQAAQACEKAGYGVERVYIDREGRWQTGEALKDMAFYREYDPEKTCRVLPLEEKGKLLLAKYPSRKKSLLGAGLVEVALCDVAFPVMHGMHGEDGTLQGLLEMLNVPYTSAGVLGSAVGMDKIAMKMLFTGCGFPVLPSLWVERDEWEEDHAAVLQKLEETLPYPMYVKPANLGSSIGINRADDREKLIHALNVAASYDRRILVERGAKDFKEVNCAVLGYAGDVKASILEMPAHWDEMLTFEGKYLQQGKGSGKAGMAALARQIPAPIPEELTERIRDLSCKVFRAMDLKGVVRIDYILEGDQLFLNEVNTIPGSLAFYLWEPVGITFAKLMEIMVEKAFVAYADKQRNVFSFDSNILQAQLKGSKGAKGAKV